VVRISNVDAGGHGLRVRRKYPSDRDRKEKKPKKKEDWE
jgi:hypothetical protein